MLTAMLTSVLPPMADFNYRVAYMIAQTDLLTSRPTHVSSNFVTLFEDVCLAQSDNVSHYKEQQHDVKVMLKLNY